MAAYRDFDRHCDCTLWCAGSIREFHCRTSGAWNALPGRTREHRQPPAPEV